MPNHNFNTQYGSELGIYVQRDVEDKKTFAENWDRIFGKKDKEVKETEDASTQGTDNS